MGRFARISPRTPSSAISARPVLYQKRVSACNTREYIIAKRPSYKMVIIILCCLIPTIYYSYLIYLALAIISVIPTLLTPNTETLLLIKSIGVQISSTTPLHTKSKFIPLHEIQDIVINEAITMCTVKFYLAIILRDADNIIVVFEVLYIILKLTISRD